MEFEILLSRNNGKKYENLHDFMINFEILQLKIPNRVERINTCSYALTAIVRLMLDPFGYKLAASLILP